MQRGWMDGFKPEPFTEREAFLWSIEHAAFEEHAQWFKGHAINVARGEFATSLRDMAEAFDWSVKRVRGFMERMGKAGKWAQRQAHDGAQSPTVLSVVNYDKYQRQPMDEGTVAGTAKGTRGAQQGHSRGTQQKEGKQGKERKEEGLPLIGELIDVPASAFPPALIAVSPVPSVPAVDDVTPAFAAYQALRSEFVAGARPLKLDPDRRTKLAARLNQLDGPADWTDVLARIRGSPFLRGETSRTGFVTIDWLLEPKNIRKVIEGNYDERPHAGPAGQPRPGSAIAAMRGARAALGFGGP